MASNKELTKQAQTLAAELGITIEDMPTKNAPLVALVSDLKAKKKDAENVTQADGVTPDAPPAEHEGGEVGAAFMEDEPAGPIIAEGKSVTSKRGILGPGDAVFESDFADEEAFAKFQKTGHIVPAKG